MYRDDRQAFEARLEERREHLAQARERHRRLTAELDQRRALFVRRRVLRVLVVGVPVLGVGVVTLGLVSLQQLVFPPARARVAAIESRVAEIGGRSAPAQAKLEANDRERQRQRQRLTVSPTATTALDSLYGELRYRDASRTDDAWLITGAVSCARREFDVADTAREALPAGHRSELERLCAPWRTDQ